MLLNMHVELHDTLFQMNQIACWVTCMLNNMKFSMFVNMHVSEHDMLFLDEPTLRLFDRRNSSIFTMNEKLKRTFMIAMQKLSVNFSTLLKNICK